MDTLKGKVVFITGASSGIGAALAKECAGRGAKVALIARRLDKLEALVQIIGRENAIALKADVTNREQLDEAVQETRNRFHRIDVCFANAGFGVIGPFKKLTYEDYQRQFETNVFGVLNTLWACFDSLRESKGHVGIMGSVAGYCTLAGMSPYSMSKHAIRAFAEGLFFEWRRYQISVTHIAPGFVESEIRHVDNHGRFVPNSKDGIPMRLQMPADRAARQMVRAVMNRQQEIVVTGHGKAFVFAKKHFWPLMRNALLLGKIGGRKQAKESLPATE